MHCPSEGAAAGRTPSTLEAIVILKPFFANALSIVTGLTLGIGTGYLSAQSTANTTSSRDIGWPGILAISTAILLLAGAVTVTKKFGSERGRHL